MISKGSDKLMKIILQDRTETGIEIPVFYSGCHKIHLEGSILNIEKDEMEIGLSFFEEDIVSQDYDEKQQTLILKYRHFSGVRIAILPMMRLKVPSSMKKIIIEDAESSGN